MGETSVLSDLERNSLRIVVVLSGVCVAAATAGGYVGWWLVVACSMGALGGLVHEIAQSGGKVLFFERHDDGLYLGAVAGIILGAIAGLLMVRGSLAPSASPDAMELTYESLIAGLGLKGVVEAAGGSPPPKATGGADGSGASAGTGAGRSRGGGSAGTGNAGTGRAGVNAGAAGTARDSASRAAAIDALEERLARAVAAGGVRARQPAGK